MNGKSFFWTVFLCVTSWIMLGAVVVQHLHVRQELATIKANAKADLDACRAEVQDVTRQRDDVQVALDTALEKVAFWQGEAARLQTVADKASSADGNGSWHTAAPGLLGLLVGGAVGALAFGAFRAGYQIQAPVVRRQRATGCELVKW